MHTKEALTGSREIYHIAIWCSHWCQYVLYLCIPRRYFFCGCIISVLCWGLFIDALWPPAGKGLTSWLSFMMLNCVFTSFPCGILGQVWCLIVSIPDLCPFNYFCHIAYFKRSGSVVECLTRDRRAAGLSLTGVTVLCPWARTLILAENWFNPGRPVPIQLKDCWWEVKK